MPKRHGLGEALDVVEVEAGAGIVGDWRSHPGRGRQLTLIAREDLDAAAAELGSAILPGASRRQLEVAGVDLKAAIGHTLRVGGLRLRVDGPCDPCRRMEATIGIGARDVLEGRGGVCARVLLGGTLRTGDAIELEG